MKITNVILPRNCNYGACPSILLAEGDSVLVQGARLSSSQRESLPVPDHEDVVRIPKAVFDDLLSPDAERSACLTRAAREGNFRLRDIGYLPYVGPAVSSIALTLPPLLAAREVLASVLVDGIYFGAPARQRWGVYPAARRIGRGARAELDALHALLRARAVGFGTLFADP